MVAVRDAVKLSLQNLQDIFPGELMTELRLEEVTLSDDERKWNVTVSFLNPDFERELESRAKNNNGLAHVLNQGQQVSLRRYKTVTVSAAEGKLLGVKNDWEIVDR